MVAVTTPGPPAPLARSARRRFGTTATIVRAQPVRATVLWCRRVRRPRRRGWQPPISSLPLRSDAAAVAAAADAATRAAGLADQLQRAPAVDEPEHGALRVRRRRCGRAAPRRRPTATGSTLLARAGTGSGGSLLRLGRARRRAGGGLALAVERRRPVLRRSMRGHWAAVQCSGAVAGTTSPPSRNWMADGLNAPTSSSGYHRRRWQQRRHVGRLSPPTIPRRPSLRAKAATAPRRGDGHRHRRRRRRRDGWPWASPSCAPRRECASRRRRRRRPHRRRRRRHRRRRRRRRYRRAPSFPPDAPRA